MPEAMVRALRPCGLAGLDERTRRLTADEEILDRLLRGCPSVDSPAQAVANHIGVQLNTRRCWTLARRATAESPAQASAAATPTTCKPCCRGENLWRERIGFCLATVKTWLRHVTY